MDAFVYLKHYFERYNEMTPEGVAIETDTAILVMLDHIRKYKRFDELFWKRLEQKCFENGRNERTDLIFRYWSACFKMIEEKTAVDPMVEEVDMKKVKKDIVQEIVNLNKNFLGEDLDNEAARGVTFMRLLDILYEDKDSPAISN